MFFYVGVALGRVFRVCFWWAESGVVGGVVLKVWCGCDLGWFFDVSVVLGEYVL